MSEDTDPQDALTADLAALKHDLNEKLAIDTLRQARAKRFGLSAEEILVDTLWGTEKDDLLEKLEKSTPELESQGRIRFEMNDGSTIEEFSAVLLEFNEAYTAIRFFLRRLAGNDQSLNDLLNFPPPNPLPTLAQPVMGAASFNSPGFWEAIASWNPLKVMCDYLEQRHERKKDNNYRNAIEQELGELEIVAKRNEVLAQQVETLKRSGFSDQEIKELMSKYIANSLENLGKRVDSGQITRIEADKVDDDWEEIAP